MSARPIITDPSASDRDLLTKGPIPANPFVYPEGDTKTLVTYEGAKLQGLVRSQSVCGASPVLKNFIFPPWSSSAVKKSVKSSQPKVLDCAEDNGEALLVLLDIIHLKFQDVPAQPTTETLYHIAGLCELYQCIGLVAPWAQSWVAAYEKTYPSSKGLMIAYTFGNDRLFEAEVRCLTYCGYYGADGQFWHIREDPVNCQLPPGLLESILEFREKMMKAAVAIPYAELARYEATSDCICQVLVGDTYRSSCDSLIHGSIIRALMKNYLYPLQTTKNIATRPRLSLDVVEGQIYHIHRDYVNAVGMAAGGPGGDHSACRTASFGTEVAFLLDNNGSPVLDSHKEHMRIQREKLGSRMSAEGVKKRKRGVSEEEGTLEEI